MKMEESVDINKLSGEDDLCEMCTKQLAKYTCPGCELRTCSLPCVKSHKITFDCNGLRKKTGFVKIENFSDLNLLSDYRFLEETSRCADNAYRNKSVKPWTSNMPGNLPKHLNKLRSHCYKKGINLQFMPLNFSKRKTNTTYLDYRLNELFWCIELILEDENKSVIDNRISDERTVEEYVKSHMETTWQKHSSIYKLDPCNISIVIKEEAHNRNPRYHEVSISQTIAEALNGKTFIEFPTIVIVKQERLQQFLARTKCTNKRKIEEL